MHEQPSLTETEEAEAFVRSVMTTEQANEVFKFLTPDQIFMVKNTVERGKAEQERWENARREGRLGEMVAKYNAKSEAIRVASQVLLPEQINDITTLLDAANDEKLAWEKARKEGRTQEMVDAYNKASASGELSRGDRKRAWFSSFLY